MAPIIGLSLRLRVNIYRVPSRLGFHRSDVHLSGAVLFGGIFTGALESYCGRMGSGCQWSGSIWGGIVGVFSVVAGWLVEYSEELECYS